MCMHAVVSEMHCKYRTYSQNILFLSFKGPNRKEVIINGNLDILL